MQNRPAGVLESFLDYPDLVRVAPLDGHRLEATFNSGETLLVDISPYLEKELFSPLKDDALFRQARAEYGGVVWNDEIDLAQEELYDKGVPVADAA